jgi:hypothetical protein
MNFENPKIKPQIPEEKPREEPWQDIYGETEIEFGPGGRVRITERKSGEVEEKKLEKPDDPFYSLSEDQQKEVSEKLKEYEESGELKHLSPAEQQEAIAEKRRKLSQEMLK